MRSLKRLIYLKIARMSRGSNTPVPSIISCDTKIKGDIWGGDTIHIDGKLEGNIMCNEVIIGTRGYIVGDIKAKSLSVYGTINGVIDTDELFVANNARLIGNAYYNKIALEPGAYIEGNCVPRNRRPEAQAKPAAAQVQPKPAEQPKAESKLTESKPTEASLKAVK
ncbi:MAG: polymer-forming cytoskeletal protein [Alphaproteobacteria bacterium]|nr:polymer-forming cytoskeletal protein [Alphaproteobacteria bacterium]